MSSDRVLSIVEDVAESVFKEFEPKLYTAIGKRNHRKPEELERFITEGVNDTIANLASGATDDEIREVATEKIRRSALCYINEPLIYSVVRKFDNLPISEEDRLSAARKGFITALNLFDPSRGYQLSTFAYRLMMNEIIAIDKDRKRQSTIRYDPRLIYTPKDLEVIRIEKSVGHRIIRINREVQELKNITVRYMGEEGEYTYHYLYQVPDEIIPGAKVLKGQVLGTLAGAEIDLASVEVHVAGESKGETVFVNPTASKSEGFRRPDKQQTRDQVLDLLKDGIASLSDSERLVLEQRILPARSGRTNLSKLAEELSISTASVKRMENIVLNKLRDYLEDQGVEPIDLRSFY